LLRFRRCRSPSTARSCSLLFRFHLTTHLRAIPRGMRLVQARCMQVGTAAFRQAMLRARVSQQRARQGGAGECPGRGAGGEEKTRRGERKTLAKRLAQDTRDSAGRPAQEGRQYLLPSTSPPAAAACSPPPPCACQHVTLEPRTGGEWRGKATAGAHKQHMLAALLRPGAHAVAPSACCASVATRTALSCLPWHRCLVL
jgi:hypothetical protein